MGTNYTGDRYPPLRLAIRDLPINFVNAGWGGSFMKRVLVLIPFIFLSGCNRAPQPIVNSNSLPDRPVRSGQAQNTIAHTTENQPPSSAGAPNAGRWSQSGDPLDTSTYDSAIATADGAMKAKPADDTAKKALADAYFARGFALTEARQYASAIGDYRRALKLDPDHEDSKKWIEQIMSIYSMLKKEAPKEGEEPPPLPFKREA